MTRYLPYLLLIPIVLTTLVGCKGDEDYYPTPYIGMDKVTRIELSPSSPVLAQDGKSGISFILRAYYMAGDEEAVLLQDRLDADAVTITASDGQSLTLSDVYTTTASDTEISFTAEISGGIVSDPVTIRLIGKEPVVYPRLVVPVRFYLMYTDQEESFAAEYDDAYFTRMLDRLNSVFDGTIATAVPRPYRVDAGVTFVLESVRRTELSLEDAEDTNSLVTATLTEDPEEVLHIWISNNHEGWSTGTIQPRYTFGSPDDIPFGSGRSLIPIRDIATDIGSDLEYTDYGITLNYTDLLPENTPHFAETIGTYFGLLSDKVDYRDYADDKEIPDADFMSDTYTYDLTYSSPIKRSWVKGANRYIYYSSTNIMEGVTGQTISPEQAARLRQVMTDIPYRQQGFKGEQ